MFAPIASLAFVNMFRMRRSLSAVGNVFLLRNAVNRLPWEVLSLIE